MKQYFVKIKIDSDTLFGSGEGLGASIDLDILLDEIGLPYISARRIKGLLRHSAEEVNDMLKQSGLYQEINVADIESIFGKAGQTESSNIFISNCYLKDYIQSKEWLKFLKQEYPNSFSNDTITSNFTSIRHQIQIEDGVTKDHSLRTFRVLKSGYDFEGTIEMDDNEQAVNLLALACLNLRNAGMMRNRGFGEITVKLFDSKGNDLCNQALQTLEEACTN